jgi:nucleotide-binding universal stress UspA family protein
MDRGLQKVERVLVAYAGGPEDLAAMQIARRLGSAPGAQLTLMHVVPPGESSIPGKGRSQIAAALDGLLRASVPPGAGRLTFDQIVGDPDGDRGSVRVRVIEHPSPPDAVLEEVARGYDLVVLGVHAQWDLAAGTLSLRRQRVLTESPVSILAVHPAPLPASHPAPEHAPSAPRWAGPIPG